MDDVEELAIEINGSAAGLRVYDFRRNTNGQRYLQRNRDDNHHEEKAFARRLLRGHTSRPRRSDAVAHFTPSISGGLAGCDTSTEKINRLPPKHAVVVSGTSSEGRGVFFKLKRYSQTSLEGVHELSVTFVAPATGKGAKSVSIARPAANEKCSG